jgi:hypothetical protein
LPLKAHRSMPCLVISRRFWYGFGLVPGALVRPRIRHGSCTPCSIPPESETGCFRSGVGATLGRLG